MPAAEQFDVPEKNHPTTWTGFTVDKIIAIPPPPRKKKKKNPCPGGATILVKEKRQ